MPQVPDSFVPSATTSPLGVSPMSATPVNPMRNAAPEQELQSGAATQRAGEVTTDIGERIQNQLDNAMAKQAETGFLNKVINITSGDGTAANPGYLNLKGQDAIDGLADAQTAIAKAKADGSDGLADDFQRSMYNKVASQHLLNFGRQMVDHHFQQTTQYSGESAINRANANATLASSAAPSYGQTDAYGNATGDFAKYLQIAEGETQIGTQVMKGAPALSATSAAALVNLHTQIGIGALSQMMDARAPYSKVQSVFNDMKDKDGGFAVKMQQADGSITSISGLDDRAIDTLGKMVKSYSDQESIRTAVSQNLSDAVRASQKQPTSSTGTPDYQFPIKGATVTAQNYNPELGGVAVAIPVGSNIQAPADGKVTQVGRDADDNFTMKIQHADGSVTAFTGLAAANVKIGATVQRGESVATSGAADGKTPSVLWSLTNSAGQNVDPTKAGLAPVDITKITDENVLHTALDSMRKQVTDPYLQQQATSEMESIVHHNQQMQTAAQAQVYKQASDQFYPKWNWRNITPSVFNQLTPEQQADFKDKQTGHVLQQFNQGQALKEMSEQQLVMTFYAHPDVLTPEVVDQVRSQLANSTARSLMERATAFRNSPKDVVEASAIAESVKYFANHAGIKDPDDKTQSPDDKKNYTDLMKRVLDDVDAIKTAAASHKATSDQVDNAIKQELIKHPITLPRTGIGAFFLGDSYSVDKPNYQMPKGATQVRRMSDGNMHYVDSTGNKDLGVVQ